MDLLLLSEENHPWSGTNVEVAPSRMAVAAKRKQWADDDLEATNKFRKLNGSSDNVWDQDEEVLAVDLEGACSLSALNVDLNSSNFGNSESLLLGLPSISAFKQELLSPFAHNEGCNNPVGSTTTDKVVSFPTGEDNGVSTAKGNSAKNKDVVTAPATSTIAHPAEDCRFQYVLAAATSTATKVSEETLTYLNQNQPYEIKLKKLGDLSEYRGKVFKSTVRLTFHERRLQFMEREQMAIWLVSHPGETMLEVDLPLSYGIFDLKHDSTNLNSVEFLWDPTVEVGVYIKVNCISTEFTSKKHGGEKGVPFRLLVETYLHGDQQPRCLHAASCQVKVFKLKGADRKHKQDREKILKRSPGEQEKYQCSYECTILTDVSMSCETAYQSQRVLSTSPIQYVPTCERSNSHPVSNFQYKTELGPIKLEVSTSPRTPSPQKSDSGYYIGSSFCPSWGPQQISLWLQANRYAPYLSTLASYSAVDLLRLSKDNLMQLCGIPDGIRLYNALHSRTAILTLYLCVDARDQLYRALYLSTCTTSELIAKVSACLNLGVSQIVGVYVAGPNDIKIILTDELVSHLPNHSALTIIALPDGTDKYQLLLKLSDNVASNILGATEN